MRIASDSGLDVFILEDPTERAFLERMCGQNHHEPCIDNVWRTLRTSLPNEEAVDEFAYQLLYRALRALKSSKVSIFTADHQRDQDRRVLEATSKLQIALSLHRESLHKVPCGELWHGWKMISIVNTLNHLGWTGDLGLDRSGRVELTDEETRLAATFVRELSPPLGMLLDALTEMMRERIESNNYAAPRPSLASSKAVWFREEMFGYLLGSLRDCPHKEILDLGHGLTIAAFLDDSIDSLTRSASETALKKLVKKRNQPKPTDLP